MGFEDRIERIRRGLELTHGQAVEYIDAAKNL